VTGEFNWKFFIAVVITVIAILIPIILWLTRPAIVVRRAVHDGRNTAAESVRARRNWHRAFRSITWIMRLRRRWAAIGMFLNHPNILSLTQGLVRRHGVLRRTATANTAAQAKAKAAAKKAFDKAAARYGAVSNR
jgi:hypothetical protein